MLKKKLLRAAGTLVVLGVLAYQSFFQYGSKIDFDETHTVYYTKGADKEDAQKIGDSL